MFVRRRRFSGRIDAACSGYLSSFAFRIPPPVSSQLWTVKYAPTSLSQIQGNKTTVEKLVWWLENWQASSRSGFKKPGKHAIGTFRAALISGSPGIGKTTTAHLVARHCGYEPLEMNASDARSKKLIEVRWANWLGLVKTDRCSFDRRFCPLVDDVDCVCYCRCCHSINPERDKH